MPLPVVFGTVCAIIAMAIVVTLLIFKYRRNSQRLTEQSEVTKKKMIDLESQVARECKDGGCFVDLDTDDYIIFPRSHHSTI